MDKKNLAEGNEAIDTNNTLIKKSLSVVREQIPMFVRNTIVDGIEPTAAKVKADILRVLDDIRPIADKTFVMMKNKAVWFDRNNAALYPKFEALTLPTFTTKGQPSKNYGLDFEGFRFVAMTRKECMKSFVDWAGNPYLQDNGFKT